MKTFLQILIRSRRALLFCLALGFILSLVALTSGSQEQTSTEFLAWMLYLFAGFIGHAGAYGLIYRWKGGQWSSSIKKQVFYLTLGMISTFALVLLLGKIPWEKTPLAFTLVLVISLTMHFLLRSVRFFEDIHEAQKNDFITSTSLTFRVEGRDLQIPLQEIVALLVKDHYLDIFRYQNQELVKIETYGNLNRLEQEAKGQLLRISRSALIQKSFVSQVIKEGNKYFVLMKGMPERLPISSGKQSLAKDLLSYVE